jgi:hypothetical protein
MSLAVGGRFSVGDCKLVLPTLSPIMPFLLHILLANEYNPAHDEESTHYTEKS